MHQLPRGMKQSRGNLEELPFPAAHPVGTELQGSGRRTVPTQLHRKCPDEPLVPMTNIVAIYYPEEKILLQMNFTPGFSSKMYYWRFTGMGVTERTE